VVEPVLDHADLRGLGSVLDQVETVARLTVAALLRTAATEPRALWIKEKFGLRKFLLFGMAKARIEAVWACLAVNVMIWIRRCWRQPDAAVAA